MSSSRARLFLTSIVFSVSTVGFSPQSQAEDKSETHEQLDAVLWVQTSAEFYACAKQTFASAEEKLTLALRDSTWTASIEQFDSGNYTQKPPAIVVNLDETVWTNCGYQTRIIKEHGQHQWRHFASWCEEAKAEAIPGAVSFLKAAERLGIRIIYISPRPESTLEATQRNMQKLDLPFDQEKDKLLLGGNWPNHDKREEVGKDHRILLIVSDHLADFMLGTNSVDSKGRRVMATATEQFWGLKWFMIPNPMYGHWEFSLHDYDHSLDRESRIKNKLKALSE